MNCKPTNPEALAVYVKTWLNTVTHAFGKATQDDCDGADVMLERGMLQQGVLAPNDGIEELTPNGDRIIVDLESGDAFAITTSGEVTTDL